MSSLAAVVAAASAATSALAITTPQRTVADGSSFIPPPSCTATATSQASRTSTTTLSSAAKGHPLPSPFSRRSTFRSSGGLGPPGSSLRWINRYPVGVPVAGRDRPLLAEASGAAESAEGAAAVGSSPLTETSDGGRDVEKGSKGRDELERR